jgi:hypothetical protein
MKDEKTGFYLIDCDIDGGGKRWRLAHIQTVDHDGGSYYSASFVGCSYGDTFDEDLEVFRKGGCRIIGPFNVEQILTCISIAEYVANVEDGYLPQTCPGERPITAEKANGLARAASHFRFVDPNWVRENFD